MTPAKLATARRLREGREHTLEEIAGVIGVSRSTLVGTWQGLVLQMSLCYPALISKAFRPHPPGYLTDRPDQSPNDVRHPVSTVGPAPPDRLVTRHAGGYPRGTDWYTNPRGDPLS